MEGDGDTVYCEIKYSGLGIGLLLAAAAGTLALAVALPWPLAPKLSVVAWICATSCGACRALLAPGSMRLDRSRRMVVATRDGALRSGEARDGCFVAPFLTVVRWRPEGAWCDRTLLLFPGAADPAELRKIRVILRWA